MADLFETLGDAGISDEVMDSIGQLYLASLPDLSWAKHGIHRKGTPGFSQDARRAFAKHMFHGGQYLAKLRYADQLQSLLKDMEEHIASMVDDDTYDSPKATDVLDEMVKRHDIMMNPKCRSDRITPPKRLHAQRNFGRGCTTPPKIRTTAMAVRSTSP